MHIFERSVARGEREQQAENKNRNSQRLNALSKDALLMTVRD